MACRRFCAAMDGIGKFEASTFKFGVRIRKLFGGAHVISINFDALILRLLASGRKYGSPRNVEGLSTLIRLLRGHGDSNERKKGV